MREFNLLQSIFESNTRLDLRVLIPPGDDLAMVQIAGGGGVLLGVDQLVDRRHVDLAATPIDLVGRKAITRCLSDIAAMAATPLASLVSITLPPDFGESRTLDLFEAMRATAEQYDAPLVGGDIATHADADAPMVCSVTCLGEPGPRGAVRRDTAETGDGVYVTGALGATIDQDGGGHHLVFEPRIREALALAELLGDRLHAMIDLSDGLGRDAGHISAMSEVSIELIAEHIPCRNDCDLDRALGDGEDYELCFTAVGDVPDVIGELPVTRIGDVIEPDDDGPQCRIRDRQGTLRNIAGLGWQHGSENPRP